jgi:hypothetical protein
MLAPTARMMWKGVTPPVVVPSTPQGGGWAESFLKDRITMPFGGSIPVEGSILKEYSGLLESRGYLQVPYTDVVSARVMREKYLLDSIPARVWLEFDYKDAIGVELLGVNDLMDLIRKFKIIRNV